MWAICFIPCSDLMSGYCVGAKDQPSIVNAPLGAVRNCRLTAFQIDSPLGAVRHRRLVLALFEQRSGPVAVELAVEGGVVVVRIQAQAVAAESKTTAQRPRSV